ncbi:hypothetical protein [Paracoccus sp. TOH]|uniref:Uncharacterized protein n=1 Tax=Paracoccus simplex TaxID=2086346 RepID=A0ABV7RXW7_9RHOB|nr:hypothetical protein [Paracoccus sp. TOH]WJS83692.1 hypothetical protein NBE95_07880 [Paracoccus sp. TOH]
MDATLAPIAEGKIVATLNGSDVFDGAQVVIRKVEATTNAQGEWSLPLLVNAEGDAAATNWSIEGYNQYVAKVFEVKSLFLASATEITLGDLERTSAQNLKAAREGSAVRLVVARDQAGYEALPEGQRRDSDLVLLDPRDNPLAIHAGLSAALFRGVQRIHAGGRAVPLLDARGTTLIAGQGEAVAPQVVAPPALSPDNAGIGASVTLDIGSATGMPVPAAEWDITLNGSTIRDRVDAAQMRLQLAEPGEYALTVRWRNEAGMAEAETASLIVAPAAEVVPDMAQAAGFFDAGSAYTGAATAVTGLSNKGSGGWNLAATSSGAAIAMGPEGVAFNDGRSLQAINLSNAGVDGVFIVVRAVLDGYGSGVAQVLAANPSAGAIAIQNNNGALQARYHDGTARNIALGSVSYGQEFVVGLEIDNRARTVRAYTLAGDLVQETPVGMPGVNFTTVRTGQYVRGTVKQIAVCARPAGGAFALRFEDVVAHFRGA